MLTLLIYGHYDVQPADPLAEWRTPPFTSLITGDDLYARSASDDKGQVMAVMAALAARLQTSGRLPVNVKLLIEGEEEVFSTALHHFVVAAAGRLRCDAVLFVDSMMLSPQQPLILYGTRGNCYLEVTMRGLATDLHSGTFGGVVDNPFNVLVRLLTALQDGDMGRVLVSGFYHKVREVDDAELALINQLLVERAGVAGVDRHAGIVWRDRMYRARTGQHLPDARHSRHWRRHDRAGEEAGDSAQATAKLSMRLVPLQAPHEIAELVRAFLQRLAPPSVTLSVEVLSTSHPVLVDYRHPAVQAASDAFAAAFGNPATFTIGGVTLPIAATFQTYLCAPLIITGFGLPDDNLHAPNEKKSRYLACSAVARW